MGVSVRVLQRNRTGGYVDVEIYFKESAYAAVEIDKSEICREGPQAGKSWVGGDAVAFSQNCFLLREISVLLSRPSY